MKIRYAFFFMALIAFGIALTKYFKHEGDTEKIVAAPPPTSASYPLTLIEVGDQHQLNVPIKVNFVVFNTGKSDLYIQKVEPDCHCTVAKFNNKAIHPNDSSVITLQYNASNPGPFQSSSFVTTNSVNSPTLLVFRGVVQADTTRKL